MPKKPKNKYHNIAVILLLGSKKMSLYEARLAFMCPRCFHIPDNRNFKKIYEYWVDRLQELRNDKRRLTRPKLLELKTPKK